MLAIPDLRRCPHCDGATEIQAPHQELTLLIVCTRCGKELARTPKPIAASVVDAVIVSFAQAWNDGGDSTAS